MEKRPGRGHGRQLTKGAKSGTIALVECPIKAARSASGLGARKAQVIVEYPYNVRTTVVGCQAEMSGTAQR